MIEQVENVISKHFNVSQESLLEDDLCRDVTDAKHFLWYVLYSILGYSVNDITKRYGTTRRNFFYAISTIKECSRSQKFYSDHLKDILLEMKENSIC